MKRRNFLGEMLTTGAACMFLPGAGRVWTKLGSLLVPESNISFVAQDGTVIYRRPLSRSEEKFLIALVQQPLGPLANLLDIQQMDPQEFIAGPGLIDCGTIGMKWSPS